MCSFTKALYKRDKHMELSNGGKEPLKVGKRAFTHNKILHAAKILFESKGLTDTTIDDISIEAGIARSTFFTHFARLDDLYAELATAEMDDLLLILRSMKEENASPACILKSLLYKLIDDSSVYPRTFSELLLKAMFYPETKKRFLEVEQLTLPLFETSKIFKDTKVTTTDLYAALLGLYYVLASRKLARKEREGFWGDSEDFKRRVENFIDALELSQIQPSETKS